jgi:feruloyl esterase
MALAGLYDPTDPGLSAFANRGSKLIMWHGWADSGVSPYIALNYYEAVRRTMGADAASKFMTLYMIPGVYHCNLYGGPNFTQEDFLTPVMNWVENGAAPGEVVLEFTKDMNSSEVMQTRPVFPAQVAYKGSGDLNAASSYERVDPKEAFDDRLVWLGLDHYRPRQQMRCDMKDAKLSCETR